MMRNALPKIILGVILVLVALHFAVSNVSIRQEGTWSRPNFSISLGKTDKGAAAASSSSATHGSHHEEKPAQATEPPSMWEDLKEDVPAAVTTTSSDVVASTATLHESASHATHSALATSEPHAHEADGSPLPCYKLPGAEDVVFVIKTGATEVEEKMPVHLENTLRCYPKSLIFSDFGETYQGHVIHDAIGNVIDQIRLTHDDFDLWRRLHEKGRATLDPSELSINDHGNNLGTGGNMANGGWRLDKFKNVPMVNYTINKYPDTKWFIFTDADTYVVWSNLLKWTQKMDPTRLTYLGSAAMIGDQVFGHGGSGYVVSNALMHKAAKAYNENQKEWDDVAAGHWAGDCVLAELFEKLGATLDWAYPILQGGDNLVMNYWETGYDHRLWCYPAVTYHHITPETVGSLWHFEQEWLRNSSAQINHSDVYKQWYMPQLPHEREGWDNMVDKELDWVGAKDSWACRDLCEKKKTCMQWSFKGDQCRMIDTTRIGKADSEWHSGWMLDRINDKIKELDKCNEGDWMLPEPRKNSRSKTKRARMAAMVANKYRK